MTRGVNRSTRRLLASVVLLLAATAIPEFLPNASAQICGGTFCHYKCMGACQSQGLLCAWSSGSPTGCSCSYGCSPSGGAVPPE